MKYKIWYPIRRKAHYTVLLALLSGCAASEAQDAERMPQRMPPLVARAIDSTHRVVCYVFPNGSGDCEKF